MARPPQYDRDPYGEPTRDATAVKAAIKHLTPSDRARLLAWLLLYYQDDGVILSPQIGQRRKRIVLDRVEYWLVRVPNRTTKAAK
ncbi:MAG: hypothetical protein WCC84_03750 [Candidatus Cybelea sp.]